MDWLYKIRFNALEVWGAGFIMMAMPNFINGEYIKGAITIIMAAILFKLADKRKGK